MLMQIEKVCVIGGTGFVGRHLCQQLAAQGYRVRVPTRERERAKPLFLLPTVEIVVADVHSPAALADVVAGCDAVINLVGVLHDGSELRGFRAAHVELARNVVEACRSSGAKRLLQMSALGAASDGPSEYLRSKGEAARIVLDSGLEVTVFRPSVIFGPNDRFLNMFAGLARVLPVLVLAYGSQGKLLAMEQPEIHLHPALQAELGDVFIEAALGDRQNTFILETHSEHLILRLMRRMRESHQDKETGLPKLTPADVSVLYVEPDGTRSIVREMPLNELGELVKSWPGGFFEEGLREQFGDA